MQRCLDMHEPKLDKKLTCVMLVQSAQTTFNRKNNLQFCLDLSGQSGPTLHREITCGMLAYG